MIIDNGKPNAAEHRWPAVFGLLAALGLYGTLPTTFLPGFRYTVVVVGLGLLIPLVALNPRRLTRQTPWSRILSVGQATSWKNTKPLIRAKNQKSGLEH
ncbi:hypothetical protein J7I84_20475 [Arthrobacter sp. ISL-85]|uniref:hypothetical protein n=1 Tax=Arthrobacter sp. ISL-85 TaxID=2819115 RepID=UPI001BE67B1F|nr:hypothetical protein [Arthrobacter sp. ISL-85]MBT2568823.1 hypothetical protein [Arthrobacter sp. ISL-85]